MNPDLGQILLLQSRVCFPGKKKKGSSRYLLVDDPRGANFDDILAMVTGRRGILRYDPNRQIIISLHGRDPRTHWSSRVPECLDKHFDAER